MIGGMVTIEDTSGPKNLVGGVETFPTIHESGTMIVAALAVEADWGLTLLVDEGHIATTIDRLDTMIIAILVVEEMGWSRLLESLVDEP